MRIYLGKKNIYIALSTNNVVVIRKKNKTTVQILRDHSNWVRSIHELKKYVYTSGSDGKVIKWSKKDWKAVQVHYFDDIVSCLRIWDSKMVASSFDGTIRVLHDDYEEILIRDKDEGFTCFRVENFLLYTGGIKGSIKIWDLNKKICLKSLIAHTSFISSIELFENKIYTSSFDKTVRIWESDQCIHILQGHVMGISSMRIKFPYIITTSHDKLIGFWKISSLTEKFFFRIHFEAVNCIEVYQKKWVLLTGGWDGLLRKIF